MVTASTPGLTANAATAGWVNFGAGPAHLTLAGRRRFIDQAQGDDLSDQCPDGGAVQPRAPGQLGAAEDAVVLDEGGQQRQTVAA